ncbi:MAG: hypothetical protein H7263_09715 [Candidatus Sericytochromatia bacterium]|nr:hypothetical protein [Candidatus Sericytochromatia bacterium]
MKTKLILLILFCATSTFAQYNPPVLSTTSLAGNPNQDPNFSKNGNYAIDYDSERDQYVGLWRYNQNGILFDLKIEKRDKLITKYIYQGVILGYKFSDDIIFKYRLVKNGIELYNNLNDNIPDDYPSRAKKFGIHDFAGGIFVDATYNVGSHMSVKLINPDTIFFDLGSGTYFYLNPDSYYETLDHIFTVPTDGIEMVRVN